MAMHRLQVSLSKSQVDFLVERARREGVSIAELVRQLVERAAATRVPRIPGSILSIAGIADDHRPLIDSQPVSERSDLYLAAAAAPERASRPSAVGKPTARGKKQDAARSRDFRPKNR
jgi:hypothetical protein